jgi:hypothetical protein
MQTLSLRLLASWLAPFTVVMQFRPPGSMRSMTGTPFLTLLRSCLTSPVLLMSVDNIAYDAD